MSRFVIDASVVLTWCFPDENAVEAQHVADRFQRGDTAIAPSFWPQEVLNALLTAERHRRIPRDLVQGFLDDLMALPIELEICRSEMVFARTLSLSREHKLTAYDAAYLDLSVENRLPLATLDEHLIRACKKAGVGLVRPG